MKNSKFLFILIIFLVISANPILAKQDTLSDVNLSIIHQESSAISDNSNNINMLVDSSKNASEKLNLQLINNVEASNVSINPVTGVEETAIKIFMAILIVTVIGILIYRFFKKTKSNNKDE